MENQDPGAAPAGKRSFKKLIILVLMLLLLAGGGVGGFYYWRTSRAAAAEDGNGGKKSKSGKSKKSKEPAEDEETEEETEPSEHASSEEDVKAIVELPPFIINLADSEQARYLRMTVSLGIGGGEGESEKPDPVFSTKARNAILGVLTSKKSDEILTADGKAKLRKEILEAARAASEEPHVAAVYITEFIVQL